MLYVRDMNVEDYTASPQGDRTMKAVPGPTEV
jgi:hypothetical protein